MPLLSLPFAFQLPQLPPTDITAGTDNLCANLVEMVALPLTASVPACTLFSGIPDHPFSRLSY